jgi:hypothetical protein
MRYELTDHEGGDFLMAFEVSPFLECRGPCRCLSPIDWFSGNPHYDSPASYVC